MEIKLWAGYRCLWKYVIDVNIWLLEDGNLESEVVLIFQTLRLSEGAGKLEKWRGYFEIKNWIEKHKTHFGLVACKKKVLYCKKNLSCVGCLGIFIPYFCILLLRARYSRWRGRFAVHNPLLLIHHRTHLKIELVNSKRELIPLYSNLTKRKTFFLFFRKSTRKFEICNARTLQQAS